MQNTLSPYPLLTQRTQQFIHHRQDTTTPLPLALFYGYATETSSDLNNNLPQDVINHVVMLYSMLHNKKRLYDWQQLCNFVYPQHSHVAQLLLPFMTVTEQQKICKSYYLGKQKKLSLLAKKIRNSIIHTGI